MSALATVQPSHSFDGWRSFSAEPLRKVGATVFR